MLSYRLTHATCTFMMWVLLACIPIVAIVVFLMSGGIILGLVLGVAGFMMLLPFVAFPPRKIAKKLIDSEICPRCDGIGHLEPYRGWIKCMRCEARFDTRGVEQR